MVLIPSNVEKERGEDAFESLHIMVDRWVCRWRMNRRGDTNRCYAQQYAMQFLKFLILREVKILKI